MFGRKIDVVSKHVEAEKLFGKGRTAFMRFLPDDNLDGAIDDAKKGLVDDDAKKKQEVDKERQRADQEAANAKKSREKAEQLEAANTASQAALASLEAEKQALEQKLAQAQEKASDAQLPALDVGEMDGNEKVLAQSIISLQEQLKANTEAAKKERDAQQAKINQYEANEAAKVQQAKNDAGYNELLTDLDTEYGADCRNEAVAAYQEMWTNGDIDKTNGAKCTRALEKCYKDAKAKRATQKKPGNKGFSPDTGAGGGRPGGAISTLNTKQGDRSLAEVTAEAKGAVK